MLFVYWLDDNPLFAKRVASIHARMSERKDELITSAVTLGEVLAGVYRKGPVSRVDEVRDAMLNVLSEIVSFTTETSDHYARIRGSMKVTSADAIHLACAASAKTDLFLTNDKNLAGKFVPGIQFIASLDTQLF
jgi:predicted nucleic acid-binding protein